MLFGGEYFGLAHALHLHELLDVLTVAGITNLEEACQLAAQRRYELAVLVAASAQAAILRHAITPVSCYHCGGFRGT